MPDSRSLPDALDSLTAKLLIRPLTPGEAAEAVDTIFAARKHLHEQDDLLRRLSEWDMLYVDSAGIGNTADAPYWQREIAKVRDGLR